MDRHIAELGGNPLLERIITLLCKDVLIPPVDTTDSVPLTDSSESKTTTFRSQQERSSSLSSSTSSLKGSILTPLTTTPNIEAGAAAGQWL